MGQEKISKIMSWFRKGRHEKKVFFNGRTTKKRGGVLTPLTNKKKHTFFYQLKKLPKPHEPLSSRGGDLSGPTTEKHFYMCIFP